ncbi:MAG: hypothetical protein CFE45_19690 [Burkholderiales bacterium PBB5]|nr:MAG: hypothetical protein CFE45_19690 [Burkholderiales bacterium PBB5]
MTRWPIRRKLQAMVLLPLVVVLPLPSWPSTLRPMPSTAPPAQRTRVKSRPMSMRLTSRPRGLKNRVTSKAASAVPAVVSLAPAPSALLRCAPQAYTPLSLKATSRPPSALAAASGMAMAATSPPGKPGTSRATPPLGVSPGPVLPPKLVRLIRPTICTTCPSQGAIASALGPAAIWQMPPMGCGSISEAPLSTLTGKVRVVVLWSPSCPTSLRPQAETVPSVCRATTLPVSLTTTTLRTPLRPCTRTGAVAQGALAL